MKKAKKQSKGYIGEILGIQDMNNEWLRVGDKVKFIEHTGRLLYNPSCGKYGIALENSMWYGDNEYDINSYGKFISIPLDNGAKMELTKIST